MPSFWDMVALAKGALEGKATAGERDYQRKQQEKQFALEQQRAQANQDYMQGMLDNDRERMAYERYKDTPEFLTMRARLLRKIEQDAKAEASQDTVRSVVGDTFAYAPKAITTKGRGVVAPVAQGPMASLAVSLQPSDEDLKRLTVKPGVKKQFTAPARVLSNVAPLDDIPVSGTEVPALWQQLQKRGLAGNFTLQDGQIAYTPPKPLTPQERADLLKTMAETENIMASAGKTTAETEGVATENAASSIKLAALPDKLDLETKTGLAEYMLKMAEAEGQELKNTAYPAQAEADLTQTMTQVQKLLADIDNQAAQTEIDEARLKADVAYKQGLLLQAEQRLRLEETSLKLRITQAERADARAERSDARATERLKMDLVKLQDTLKSNDQKRMLDAYRVLTGKGTTGYQRPKATPAPGGGGMGTEPPKN